MRLSKQAFLNPSFPCGIRPIVNISVIFAAIAWLAQGLDILNIIRPAQRNWVYVVNRQGQIGTPTFKTPVAIVGTKLLPLVGCIRPPIPKFLDTAAIVPRLHLVRVFLPVIPVSFRNRLRVFIRVYLVMAIYSLPVFGVPIPSVFKKRRTLFGSPLSSQLSRPFAIVFSPTRSLFSALFKIVLTVFTIFCSALFPMIISKSCRDFLYFIRVASSPLLALRCSTLDASATLVPPTCAAFFARRSVSGCHRLLQIKTPQQDAQKCDLVSLVGVLINKYSVLNFSSNISLGRTSIIPKYTSAINVLEGGY